MSSTVRRKSSKNLIVAFLFRMERMPTDLKTKSVSCLLEMARKNDVTVSYTQHCTVAKGSSAHAERSSHLREMTVTSAREQKKRNKSTSAAGQRRLREGVSSFRQDITSAQAVEARTTCS